MSRLTFVPRHVCGTIVGLGGQRESLQRMKTFGRAADEARSIAGSLTHPAAKREILLVAEQFEALARQARKRSARRKWHTHKVFSPRPRR